MKIVIVSNVTGGLYSFRRELIEILAKENSVTILATDTGRVEDFKQMGCKFINVDMDRHGMNPLAEVRLYSNYKKLIGSESPDIVLTYTIKPNIYAGAVCASLGIRYVANITGLGTAVETKSLMQGFMLRLYKFGLRKAQKVFFQNTANMDFMVQKGIVTDNYELIPGSGVNLEHYHVLDYPENDTVDFAYIGRVMKQKGIDQYLDAARAIRAEHPETRFHICGRCTPEYEDLIKELNDNGTVIYHGLLADVSEMHKISCCTLHPSYYPEGMSNVLLESCACARPVITTDRPGCREIVDNGVNGYIIKQRDSEDLIRKVETFLGLSLNERKQMGLAGRAKVEKEFDRQIVVNKYLSEVYK